MSDLVLVSSAIYANKCPNLFLIWFRQRKSRDFKLLVDMPITAAASSSV